MKPLSDEDKEKLKAAGRQDLIDTHELLMSGYAGINQHGTIVDRREFPKAIPMPAGGPGDSPPPKPWPVLPFIAFILILCSCSQREIIEPKFCWTCYEQNAAVKGNHAIIGEGFTDFCSKTPTEISDIEAQSFERILPDSTKLTHQIRCTKSEKR